MSCTMRGAHLSLLARVAVFGSALCRCTGQDESGLVEWEKPTKDMKECDDGLNVLISSDPNWHMLRKLRTELMNEGLWEFKSDGLPQIVHTVQHKVGMNETGSFTFENFLSVMAIRNFIQPKVILFYADHEPVESKFYQEAKPYLRFVQLRDFNEVPGINFIYAHSPASRTEVLRILVMFTFGGFWQDLDWVPLRPFSSISAIERFVNRGHDSVMFAKGGHAHFFMARPCSEFVFVWCTKMLLKCQEKCDKAAVIEVFSDMALFTDAPAVFCLNSFAFSSPASEFSSLIIYQNLFMPKFKNHQDLGRKPYAANLGGLDNWVAQQLKHHANYQAHDVLKSFLNVDNQWARLWNAAQREALGSENERPPQEPQLCDSLLDPFRLSETGEELNRFRVIMTDTVPAVYLSSFPLSEDMYVSKLLWQSGFYEEDMLNVMLAMMSEGPQDGFFLDVGANIGAFSFLMAANGYDVFGFEAFIPNFRHLQRSECINQYVHSNRDHFQEVQPKDSDGNLLSLARGRVQFILTALADESDLMVSVVGQNGNPSQASVDAVAGCNPCRKDNSSVSTSRLDDHMMPNGRALGGRQISVMKMDVEGYEANVLAGASVMLMNNAPKYLIMEFRPQWLDKGKYGARGVLYMLNRAEYVMCRDFGLQKDDIDPLQDIDAYIDYVNSDEWQGHADFIFKHTPGVNSRRPRPMAAVRHDPATAMARWKAKAEAKNMSAAAIASTLGQAVAPKMAGYTYEL